MHVNFRVKNPFQEVDIQNSRSWSGPGKLDREILQSEPVSILEVKPNVWIRKSKPWGHCSCRSSQWRSACVKEGEDQTWWNLVARFSDVPAHILNSEGVIHNSVQNGWNPHGRRFTFVWLQRRTSQNMRREPNTRCIKLTWMFDKHKNIIIFWLLANESSEHHVHVSDKLLISPWLHQLQQRVIKPWSQETNLRCFLRDSLSGGYM